MPLLRVPDTITVVLLRQARRPLFGMRAFLNIQELLFCIAMGGSGSGLLLQVEKSISIFCFTKPPSRLSEVKRRTDKEVSCPITSQEFLTSYQPPGIWEAMGWLTLWERVSRRPNGVGGRRGGKELSR